jgi:uncharacterized repeat protein (TIGR03803 family)
MCNLEHKNFALPENVMKNSFISQCGRTPCVAACLAAFPLLLCLAMPTGIHAQTLTTLTSFNGTDGAYPSSQLTRAHVVQHSNGNFYGTTPYGGTHSDGVVFSVTAAGAEATVYNFCSVGSCTDGSTPEGALVAASDGNLYGTTFLGGANNDGTVFKITTAGVLTTLHSFSGTDGANPLGGITQGSDGNLYGTTAAGGTNNDGTVFKISCSGTLTTLHSFSGADGTEPGGDLVQSNANGNFYGTAYAGGAGNNGGTLFEISSSGAFTLLYSFCSATNCNDGSSPNVPLAQDSLGDFYGTTYGNGANSEGTIFVYTWWGGLHTVYHFCAQANCADGADPLGGVVLGSDFNIYGTTIAGGGKNDGTIYQFTPWHQITTLYSFCQKSGCTDGQYPESALFQGKDGNFYGTTSFGGTYDYGTAYNLSTEAPAGNQCNGAYSANFVGNVYVSSGQNCQFTDGAIIYGNVYETGGNLNLNNVTVLGNVQIVGGTYTLGPSLTISSKLEIANLPSSSTQSSVCGTNVYGSLYFDGNAAPVQIGSTSGSCAGNTIGGDLEFMSNTAAVQVFNNSASSNLTCSGNTSTVTGGGNTAVSKSGQCSSF